VPTIGICIAQDQFFNLINWQKKRFIKYIGWYNDKKLLIKLEKDINKLISYKERTKCVKIGSILIDGKGTRRVILKLTK